LLQDLIRSNEIYRAIIDNLQKNNSIDPNDLQDIALNKAIHQIYLVYEKDADNVNKYNILDRSVLGNGFIYFIWQPACEMEKFNIMCGLISNNFNLELITEAGDLKLYRISET
jgi:hypothetical protein